MDQVPINKLIDLCWLIFLVIQVWFLFSGITGIWTMSWVQIRTPTILLMLTTPPAFYWLVKKDII